MNKEELEILSTTKIPGSFIDKYLKPEVLTYVNMHRFFKILDIDYEMLVTNEYTRNVNFQFLIKSKEPPKFRLAVSSYMNNSGLQTVNVNVLKHDIYQTYMSSFLFRLNLSGNRIRKLESYYEQIKQLLTSDDLTNVELACQLIQSLYKEE